MSIYMIRRKGDAAGLIKIGRSKSVQRRLKELQIAIPEGIDVVVTAPGGAREETYIHRKFSHLRIAGEWYAPDAEMLEFADSVRRNGVSIPEEIRVVERQIPPIVRETREDLLFLIDVLFEGSMDTIERARFQVCYWLKLDITYAFRLQYKVNEMVDVKASAYCNIRIAALLIKERQGKITAKEEHDLSRFRWLSPDAVEWVENRATQYASKFQSAAQVGAREDCTRV